MSALVAQKLSGSHWWMKEGASETDRAVAGDAQDAIRGHLWHLAEQAVDPG